MAPTAAAKPFAPRTLPGTARDLARLAVLAIVALLLLVGAVMLWRRAAGALENPLPVPALVAAAVLFATLAAGIRIAWVALADEASPRALFWVVALLSTAAVLMLGFSLSLPGTPVVGLAVLWGLIVLEEAWGVQRLLRKRPTAVPEVERDAPSVAEPSATSKDASALPNMTIAPNDDVLQQLTRTRDADGTERLSGWLRATFAAGQRTESVHLAFCPPFERTPRLAVEQDAGPAVRVKTAQLLPYGARLDLKLGETAVDEEWVLLQFTAESPLPKAQQPGDKS